LVEKQKSMDPSETEEGFVNDVMTVNLKHLQLVGLWRGNRFNTQYPIAMKIYTIYRWSVLIIMYLHVATELLDIAYSWGDIENLAANGSITLLYASSVIKQTNFLLREDRIRGLIQRFRTGFFSTSLKWGKEYRDISRQANKRANIVSWSYYYLCIATIVSFFVSAIITSYGHVLGLGNNEGNQTVKTLVFQARFPFDIQQSGNYEIAFLFQLITCSMGPTINVGMDAFMASLMINCCGEFRLLKYSLRKIKERAEELLAQEKMSQGGDLVVLEHERGENTGSRMVEKTKMAARFDVLDGIEDEMMYFEHANHCGNNRIGVIVERLVQKQKRMDPSETEESFVNDVMTVNLKHLQLVGLWRGNRFNTQYPIAMKIFTIYRWTLLLFMYLNIATEVLDIAYSWGDIENLAANGSVTLLYASNVIKQTNFLLREDRIRGLIQRFRTGFFSTSLKWGKEYRDISRQANKRANIVSWSYYYLCIATIVSFFVSAIVTSYGHVLGLRYNEGNQTVKTLVFPARFPFDIQQPGNYEIAFLFQLITCSMGPTINVGMDAFMASLMINCCGEFRLLKYSLRKIKERAEELLAQEKMSHDGDKIVRVHEIEENIESQIGQTNELNHQTYELNHQTYELNHQTYELNNQAYELNHQTYELNHQTYELNNQAYELNHQTYELNDQAYELNHQTYELNNQAYELNHQTYELNDQAYELNHQTYELNDQAYELNHQTYELNHQAYELNHQTYELNNQAYELNHQTYELNHQTYELNH
ncbi:hypothetical protein ANN_07566, partial [Periplaneta americana]